jgi:enoyl-CoA hydratase/carnithine racemase
MNHGWKVRSDIPLIQSSGLSSLLRTLVLCRVVARSGTVLNVRKGDVTVDVHDYVGVVELHRPPNNFFDTDFIRGIADAVVDLDNDPACRAIVLCSEGKHFCAGAKLDRSNDASKSPAALYEQAIRLFGGQLPIVAAVQGAAVGGGLGLALVADFRVASPDTRFDCNFARLGFHHGFGISVTLPAVVGQQRALEMLYTGGQVKGEQGMRIGLCDRLVPTGQLRETAVALAAEIAASGPLAVRAIRETMRQGLVEQVRLATEREGHVQIALSTTDDFAEGVRAMAGRHSPNFLGR